MTAYDILKGWNGQDTLDEIRFNQLIKDFQHQYLEDEGYVEKVLQHRNSIEVKNALLQKLYKYDLEIQNREEMRDHNIETRTSGYVPSIVKELWMSDKRLRSLYNSVKKYCELRKKDFNTIAIHIAEYRAINKLSARVRKHINSTSNTLTVEKSKVSTPYTFEDWLKNKFYNEKTISGEHVANDSENYLDLVNGEKMSYEELNKIQDAQQKAYDYMIEYSVRSNERQFQRQTKETLDLRKVIDIKMEEIGKYFRDNMNIHKEVLLPRLHRKIKWGAKFLLPEHYTAAINKEVSDVHIPTFSKYNININGKMVSFPTAGQLKYAVMEIQFRWLKILHSYRAKIKFDEMLSSKDFKTLIDNYGEGDKLLESYLEGLNFAPDRELFIKTRIKNYESILPKYQSGTSAWDKQNKTQIQIPTGEYRRIGYAWVNNGYNGKRSDLETMTLRNVTLCIDVPPEGRYGIYINVLHQLATGGAIAFHLAFLREQLKEQVLPKKKKSVIRNFWQGTDAQKIRLFEVLSAESFIQPSGANRTKFLNNKSVQWKEDGRSLFYLLNQLKEKKFKLLHISENLGPIIRDNFLNKNGEPFKNVSQNMSGMFNSTKNGKPKLAKKIDEVLQKVLEG